MNTLDTVGDGTIFAALSALDGEVVAPEVPTACDPTPDTISLWALDRDARGAGGHTLGLRSGQRRRRIQTPFFADVIPGRGTLPVFEIYGFAALDQFMFDLGKSN